MFFPSDMLRVKMQSSRAGLWFERVNENMEIVLALKLSSDLIKAIFCGAKTSIIVSVIELEGSKVRCIGFRIYDGVDNPITIFRTHTDTDEHLLFENMLIAESNSIYFLDELLRSVMDSTCSFSHSEATEILKSLILTKPHYVGVSRQLTEKALDIFQSDLDNKSKESIVWHELSTEIKAHELSGTP